MNKEQLKEMKGKRVFRDKTDCTCLTCDKVWKKGLIVPEEDEIFEMWCDEVFELGIVYYKENICRCENISGYWDLEMKYRCNLCKKIKK